MTAVSYEDLVAYWQGELSGERESWVEERLFDDAETARRLDVVARLGEGVRALVRSGRLQSGLTVAAVDSLERHGLRLRTYRLGPGEVAPCSIEMEDFVVVRLHGPFEAVDRVNIEMEGTMEGAEPMRQRAEDVLVDREASEVVFVYPGDFIRSLPRSQFVFRVTDEGGRSLGEFGLDHTPS